MTEPRLRIQRLPVLSRTLEPAQHTNDYLVGDHREAILVDAGFVDDSGLAILDQAWQAWGTPRLRAVLVTHGHQDHARGLGALTRRFGVPVYAHARELPRIATSNPGLKVETIAEGDRFHVAGAVIEVIETPGHTEGHLSFWMPALRTLLCGDTMAGEGTVWVGPPDGDMSKYLASLARIRDLAPARIGPGHGPWIEEPIKAVAELIEHRLQRERQILDLLASGPKTPLELAQKIYAGQVPARVLPFAERTVIAHLRKLVEDGRVVDEGERYRIV